MYLRNAELLEFGWSRHARFVLKIISPLRTELSFKRGEAHSGSLRSQSGAGVAGLPSVRSQKSEVFGTSDFEGVRD